MRTGCKCDRLVKGTALDLDAGQCSSCWMYWHVEAVNLKRGGDGQVFAVDGPIAKPVTKKKPSHPSAIPECVHRGEGNGKHTEIPCLSCGGVKMVRIKHFSCAVHGECTPGTKVNGVTFCKECKDCLAPLKPEPPKLLQLGSPAVPTPFEWVSTEQLTADSLILASKLPARISGVAGIPRSGMLPASIIAVHLHVPLYQVADDGRLIKLGHGSRGRTTQFMNDGPIVVVDDTVYGGNAMGKVRLALAKTKHLFAAVYVRPETAHVVDLFVRHLPSPHLLEWNIVNSGPFAGHAANPAYRRGVACDFDGIICHDEESPGKTGTPYLIPRSYPCRLIVTGRYERHRQLTEAWLAAHGAKYDRLEMLPDDQEQTPEAIAAHKAHHYGVSDLGFFMESDIDQAERIFEITKKPVICPRAKRVWQ